MKHGIKHNQLGRNTKQAKALYRGVAESLLERGRIETTLAKAKATIALVDKLINLGKMGDANARRKIVKLLGSNRLVEKITILAKGYDGRNSGYTRITKLGPRFSDTAKMVFFELVESTQTPIVEEKSEVKTQEEIITKEAGKRSEAKKPTSPKKSAAVKKSKQTVSK